MVEPGVVSGRISGFWGRDVFDTKNSGNRNKTLNKKEQKYYARSALARKNIFAPPPPPSNIVPNDERRGGGGISVIQFFYLTSNIICYVLHGGITFKHT